MVKSHNLGKKTHEVVNLRDKKSQSGKKSHKNVNLNDKK